MKTLLITTSILFGLGLCLPAHAQQEHYVVWEDIKITYPDKETKTYAHEVEGKFVVLPTIAPWQCGVIWHKFPNGETEDLTCLQNSTAAMTGGTACAYGTGVPNFESMSVCDAQKPSQCVHITLSCRSY